MLPSTLQFKPRISRPISLRRLSNPPKQSILPNISNISIEKSVNFSMDFQQELPLPIVTAKSWSICNARNGECLWSKAASSRLEMASLTKMMTAYLSYMLSQKFQINLSTTIVIITKPMVQIGGTIGDLKEGDHISLMQLLYGLMLPSGNDCSLALADYFGGVLLEKFLRSVKQRVDLSFEQRVRRFIKEMNSLGLRMAIKNTSFANVHGLSHKGNKSTAEELGKLACLLLKCPIMKEIVKTRVMELTLFNEVMGQERKVLWRNTNKLLGREGFAGVKTGTTPNAGACLTVLYSREDVELIITVLACNTTKHRWDEARLLAEWGYKNFIIKGSRINRKSLYSAKTDRTDR